LTVDVTDRVATVNTPYPSWKGFEIIWFKACDPGGLCDSNEATFTVIAFNDTPVVSDVPDQIIEENDSFVSINLDDYVTDPDDDDSVMIWSHWGEAELLVDVTDRIATVTIPDSEWNDSETIWFKACDPGGLCDSNEATFTVMAVNDPPLVSDIPDSTIVEGDSFNPIDLNYYVSDPDDGDSAMIWSHWGEAELLVDITDKVVTIAVPHSEWSGSETIWFKVCDPGGLCDSNQATFTVTAFNDTPVVFDIPNQTITMNDSFASVNLDDYVADPDHDDSVILWSHRGEVELTVVITDRVATVAAPDSEWSGSETVWFKACDPAGLCDSNEAIFTVTFNDTPVVLDIPDQTIGENDNFTAISLDDYVEDSNDHDSVIIWSHWGELELTVDITDRIATVTAPYPGWNGLETIWFEACDPGGLCDSNEAVFLVLVSGITDEDSSQSGPPHFLLNQNYPNPFNLMTKITCILPAACRIKLTIYDLSGRQVRKFVDDCQTSGYKPFDWDGTNESGETVASGIYFYRLETEPEAGINQSTRVSETKKMLLLK
jgi:hypothetical protein